MLPSHNFQRALRITHANTVVFNLIVYSSVHLSVIHNFHISSRFIAVMVLAGNTSISPGKESLLCEYCRAWTTKIIRCYFIECHIGRDGSSEIDCTHFVWRKAINIIMHFCCFLDGRHIGVTKWLCVCIQAECFANYHKSYSTGSLPPLIGLKTSLPSSVEHQWAEAIQHFHLMSCSLKYKLVYVFDLKLWLDWAIMI